MSAGLVEQVYRYGGTSTVAQRDGGASVALATSGGTAEHPRLYAGWIPDAPVQAQALLVVARTARSRFHVPAAMLERRLALADPVVTVDERALRFEAFSACCGVYARHDVDASALDGRIADGTTNVDFNEPMRAALAGVAADGPLHLSVGAEEVAVLTAEGAVVERRVALPVRWIKGFGEVQAAQTAMQERLDLPGTAVRRLLRELPRSGPTGGQTYVRRSGRELRLSGVGGGDAVALAGPQRLLLLEPLAAAATRLRAYGAEGGASAWVVDLPAGRLTLVLSPEVWRGFSGEGGVLRALAHDDADRAARGFAGYDLAQGAFFDRRLPFDLDAVDALTPRLHGARALVDAGAVRSGEGDEAFVRSGDVEYHVRMTATGPRCTCPWFVRHGAQRGPCKHVLAAELALDAQPQR
jgi:SWIM zinc finger